MKEHQQEKTLRASLAIVFGREWTNLSSADRLLIVRDCTEDGGVSDLEQYRRNIGAENLRSYVLTQRVRFGRKGRHQMSQHYSDPTREADPHALPDVEVFYRRLVDNMADGWADEDGELMPAGWYYWYCLPSCLPDSEPYGPYDSEQAALDAAREDQ